MIWFLRALFTVVLVSMLWVTTWASLQCGLFAIPAEVYRHPWFVSAMFDAYWGFITFFVWLAWKERSVAASLLWLVAIILLGNIAMASYFLRELLGVPSGASLEQVITRRNDGRLVLGGFLAAAGVAVYLLAWFA